MDYKKYSEQSILERKYNKWLESGRPHLWWDSSKRGAYMPNHNPSHFKITFETTNAFSAKYLEGRSGEKNKL